MHELVIVEVEHQVLGEIQDAYHYVNWTIRHEPALVQVQGGKVVVEDFLPC